MAKIHGKDTVVKIDDSGGVLRDISQDVTSVDAPQNVDTAEISGMGQSRKSYITGLIDSPITINGNFNDTASTGAHAVLSSLIGGTAGYTLEIYPAGTAAGKPKLTGEVLLSSYSISSGLGGQITFTANLVPADSNGLTWTTA